jgi:predicted Zn-dependent protease
VIDRADTVNAFALPGGHIGAYTGIFPVARTEAGLAIIIGHELGHVVARHAGERVSQRLLAELGGTALSVAVQTSPHAGAIMAAFGVGAEVGVLLPYSRLHEPEADRLGLVLAARAGYDPWGAVGVWERMAALPGERPPRFLSTHPLPEARLREIERLLPEIVPEVRPHPDPGETLLPTPCGSGAGRRIPGSAKDLP